MAILFLFSNPFWRNNFSAIFTDASELAMPIQIPLRPRHIRRRIPVVDHAPSLCYVAHNKQEWSFKLVQVEGAARHEDNETDVSVSQRHVQLYNVSTCVLC